MRTTTKSLFSFPNPVDEVAARVVAGGVLIMCVVAIAWRQQWLLVPLAYGFWARVLTGPKLSPLGQLATRVVAPRLSATPRLVPGPPKRFAQAIGLVFSSTAVVLWFGVGAHGAAWITLGLLAVGRCSSRRSPCVSGAKSSPDSCVSGLVPDTVCAACTDITHAPARAPPRAGQGLTNARRRRPLLAQAGGERVGERRQFERAQSM